ncbi:MAG: hypothetical protein WAP08_02350 [Smithellaceae bacterium]|nr:hypothetical protein [Smithellaceae bacterium]
MAKIFVMVSVFLLTVVPIVAGENLPDESRRAAEEFYLHKVNHACGTNITITYDVATLIEHNKDIRLGQTGGGNECNEPLRYLWNMCKNEKDKKAVKSAKISKMVCKGTPGRTGSLTMDGGTITVERAFEEDKYYLRSKKQFEEIFKTKLTLAVDDPYRDPEWRELKWKPNPVTDTKNYCIVNGEKRQWRNEGFDSFKHKKEDATVSCWKDGRQVSALSFKKGVKSGYETYFGDDFIKHSNYLEGRLDGLQSIFQKGNLLEQIMYVNGKEQWKTTYHPDGTLSGHRRYYAKHVDEISITKDGRITHISCSPEAKNDKELRKWCGFAGVVEHSIYDTTGLNRILTFKDGVIQREQPGNSRRASGSSVSFRGGKKHGEELITGNDGKLRASITWEEGEKNGRELIYADDGKLITVEKLWKDGRLMMVTEFYRNGNPKQRETFDEKQKRVEQFWDTGKVFTEGAMVLCRYAGYGNWCKEGVHKTYYKNGTVESVTIWKNGKLDGTANRMWENGRTAEAATYTDGKLVARKLWNTDGVIMLDEEYEEDGSVRLHK